MSTSVGVQRRSSISPYVIRSGGFTLRQVSPRRLGCIEHELRRQSRFFASGSDHLDEHVTSGFFEGTARVVRGVRGFPGVHLPPESMEFFRTRAQVRVEGRVNGQRFSGLVFPSGDGTQFLNLNAKFRQRSGVAEGDSVAYAIRRRVPAAEPALPSELADVLVSRPDARSWWSRLPPGARRTAIRFIDGAKSPEVRAWRLADVLRRAERYFNGDGPFYPTSTDQRLLSASSARRPG